ncbi:hypothetical protein D9M70_536840 [compost metagenome]
MHSLGDMLFDLHNQNDRVSDKNTDQCQHTENSHEAERFATRKQCRNHTDQPQRCHGNHEEQALEALQLQHQNGCHHEQHQRHDSCNRSLALAAFFNRASCRDGIACRKLIDKCLHRRFKLLNNRVRHRFINDTGSNSYGWNA